MSDHSITPNINFENIETVTTILKILSNPERLKILCVLSHSELNVMQIETQTGICQPTLSQQLTILRKADLVNTRRSGKQIFYQMTDPKLFTIMQTLYELYCAELNHAD